jgi:hypothetical protein
VTDAFAAAGGAGFEQAVERADQARLAIRNIIEQVRSGDLDLPQAFAAADGDELTGRCFAVKVLEAVPGIGKVRARRTMEALGIDEGIWIRDVSPEARAKVIEAFAEPA